MPQPRFHSKTRFNLYVPAGKREGFWRFVEHVEAEGQNPSDVLVNMAINYVEIGKKAAE